MTNIIENKKTVFLESTKNEVLCKKVIIDSRIDKKISVVNDYKNFYYLSENTRDTDLLYSQITLNVLKNKKFPLLKLITPLSLVNIDYKDKSATRNPILDLTNGRKKNVIVLNSVKGGFNIFYKGLLGFLSKTQFLKSLKTKISYNHAILNQTHAMKPNISVSECSMNIYFQSIKYNFAQTKKRHFNNTETSIVFISKKDEKAGEDTKTKDSKQYRK